MTKSKAQIIKQTEEYVRQKLEGEGSGHDWWHIVRVVNNAKAIAKQEGGDMFIVELGSLLHDINDWKFNDGDSTVGANEAKKLLEQLGCAKKVCEHVGYIVEHVSYKGGTNKHAMKTIEGQIVHDADRLDALCAIGVARAFAFGGSAGRVMYDPGVKPKEYSSFESFAGAITQNHTINHFYEKLLLLKDKMNTKTAKKMAKNRHEYMEKYLRQFYAEWEGSR